METSPPHDPGLSPPEVEAIRAILGLPAGEPLAIHPIGPGVCEVFTDLPAAPQPGSTFDYRMEKVAGSWRVTGRRSWRAPGCWAWLS